MSGLQTEAQLRLLAEVDVDPAPSEALLYITNGLDLEGYKRLLAIGGLHLCPIPTAPFQLSAVCVH